MKPDITTKQMGDACEMLVVAELTLAGVSAVKMPDNWPGYDLTAYPRGDVNPQKISVKSRTFKRGADSYVEYNVNDDSFDWMAVVILPNDKGEPSQRRVFIFPREVSDGRFHQSRSGSKYHNYKSCKIDTIATIVPEFENNFGLSSTGIAKSN
jgi:hypothetical protein